MDMYRQGRDQRIKLIDRNVLKGTGKPVNYPFPRTSFKSAPQFYEFHLCFY